MYLLLDVVNILLLVLLLLLLLLLLGVVVVNASKEVGLEVNREKTKYMLMSRSQKK
jgi:hypothetical protein